MCGIAGLIDSNAPSAENQARLVKMTAALSHRGPDDAGEWVDSTAGVALGHRRLSILDLSPEGHQPMASSTGRFILVFNGEIYNFNDLRTDLEAARGAIRWRGHSDTEIFLESMEQWGIAETLPRLNGMFAFAVWDREARRLVLGRDRIGKKPLYYGWSGGRFFFASELKALRAHPGFSSAINRDAVASYLRYACVPAPLSIYEGIAKLRPGTFVMIDPILRGEMPEPKAYWSAASLWDQPHHRPSSWGWEEAVKELDELLRDAVKIRMVADVPLGAFLSGGVDSSAVVAMMQAQSSRPVKTFTIGYEESAYSEAHYAKEVARHLGTDHTELYVSPQEARSAIPLLPSIYDEPFADSSQVPMFLVSRLARRQVTVALSGDGGDELFGGYNRYFMGPPIWRGVAWQPAWLRKWEARLLRLPSPSSWEKLSTALSPLLESYGTQGTFGEKFYKLAEVLEMPNADAFYHRLTSFWDDPKRVAQDGVERPSSFLNFGQPVSGEGFADRMMFFDLMGYLPDDILVKVDRASMAVSLEARAPFLDVRVVEWAWRLPLWMKIQKKKGKILLRKVLYQYVPEALIERPKMGFGMPVDVWLRGPLREWAEDLLDPFRMKQEGFLRAEVVRKEWNQFVEGRRATHAPLWVVLMFQAWLRASSR